MRTGFAVSAGASALILTALLLSMGSCDQRYQIDPQGRLMSVVAVVDPDGSSREGLSTASWKNNLPEFQGMADHVRPGDRLTHSRISAGIGPLDLRRSTLEVFRNGQSVMIVRDGSVRFWAVIAGLSALPLLFWGAAALWMGLSARKPGDDSG